MSAAYTLATANFVCDAILSISVAAKLDGEHDYDTARFVDGVKNTKLSDAIAPTVRRIVAKFLDVGAEKGSDTELRINMFFQLGTNHRGVTFG